MKTNILLISIIILSFALRFFTLSSNSSSLYWDEASLGWNSIKILETGADEYGISHPLTLKSFGDYKPALYSYFSMLPIKIFGLNEFAIRFASAFFGSLLPLTIFLILRKKISSLKIAVLAAFVTSINPWAIQFSRGAFEANLGLCILLWGVVVLIYAKNLFVEAMGIAIILSTVYIYHANKFFAPALVLIYIFLKLYKHRSEYLIRASVLIVISGILMIPFARSIIVGFGLNRLGSVTSQSTNYLANLFSHFNFDFLFLNGDYNLRHHVLGFGLFYVFESIFMFIGFFVIFNKYKFRWLFIILFILSLIPSTIAFDAPHAIRSLISFPIFLILVVLGLKKFAKNTPEKILVLGAYLFFFFLSINTRYKQYPAESASSWQYGYKQVAQYLFDQNNYEKYDKIIMTTEYDEPYIYILLYSNGKFINYINPGNAKDGFDKFVFKKINFEEEKNKKNVLIIGAPDEIKTDNNILKTIYYPNGSIAFKIITTRL